jgi:hypothetical protein
VLVGGLITIGTTTVASASSVHRTTAVHSKAVIRVGGPNHHRHHGHYGYYGRPYAYGFYAPSIVARSSGCGWLRVKARETGSRYWWHRYQECLE